MQNLMVTINSITTDSAESVELGHTGLLVPVSFKSELDNAITGVISAKMNLVSTLAFAIAQANGSLTKKSIQDAFISYLNENTNLKSSSIKDYLTDSNNISLLVEHNSLEEFKSFLSGLKINSVNSAIFWLDRTKTFAKIRSEYPTADRSLVTMPDAKDIEELRLAFKELSLGAKEAQRLFIEKSSKTAPAAPAASPAAAPAAAPAHNVQAVINSLKSYSDEDLQAIIYGLKDLIIEREQSRQLKVLAQAKKKKRA